MLLLASFFLNIFKFIFILGLDAARGDVIRTYIITEEESLMLFIQPVILRSMIHTIQWTIICLPKFMEITPLAISADSIENSVVIDVNFNHNIFSL